MRGPRDHDHPQLRDAPPGLREGRDGALQEVRCRRPEPPAATMQTFSSGAIAELLAERVAIGDLGRVEAGDVAGEVEVLARVQSRIAGRPGPRRSGDDVVGIADEDRAVAQPRMARDVLDHLARCGRRRGTPRARRPSGIGSTPTKSVSQT